MSNAWVEHQRHERSWGQMGFLWATLLIASSFLPYGQSQNTVSSSMIHTQTWLLGVNENIKKTEETVGVMRA